MTSEAPASPQQNDKVADKQDAQACELLLCGSTKWDLIGRKSLPKKVQARGGSEDGEELLGPHRLSFDGDLAEKKFTNAFSGCLAAHAVLVDENGTPWGLGRNDSGQLGNSELTSHRAPKPIPLPEGSSKIVGGSCGRSHTVLYDQDGNAYSCGNNTSGQLGIGSKEGLSAEHHRPTKVVLPDTVVDVGCGDEFSAFITKTGSLYCCGSAMYGQLGNGQTGERIGTGNKVLFDTISKPKKVSGFGSADGETRLVQVACGGNHALAVDNNGHVWSWGFGGYGQLGHNMPRDVYAPKKVEKFVVQDTRIDAVACGVTSSYGVQRRPRGSTYMWGITKKTGESNMYPKPISELQGWEVRSIGAGPTSVVAAAESSLISWGFSPTYGELGYGEGNPKSSAKPKAVDSLEGQHVSSVAVGMSFTIMLLKDTDSDAVAKLPVLSMSTAASEKPSTKSSKRKSPATPGKRKKATKSRRR